MKHLKGISSFKIIGIIICTLALGILLVGCGSNTVKGEKLIGDWSLASLTSEGETMDVASLADYGYVVTITLNKDGSYVYKSTGDDDVTGKWQGKEEATGTITLVGENLDMSLDGSNLVMKDASGGSMTFTPGLTASSSSSSSSSK